jgi:hypothetical protein
MGCPLYVRCALSIHQKKFRKSLGCALYIGARYLPENALISSEKIRAFYETCCLLSCLQRTATGAYLEKAESDQTSPPCFPNNTTNIIFLLRSIRHNPCSWNRVINQTTKLSLWTAPHLGPAVITDLSLWRAGFDGRPVHVGFMVDQVAEILSDSP